MLNFSCPAPFHIKTRVSLKYLRMIVAGNIFFLDNFGNSKAIHTVLT